MTDPLEVVAIPSKTAIDSERWALAAVAAAAALSQAGVGGMPYLFGQFVDRYGFSLTQAGIVGSLETLCYGVVMLALAVRMDRLSPRFLVLAACASLAISQAASVYALRFGNVLAARALSGASFGMIYAASTAAAARMPRPAFAYAVSTGAMTIGLALATYGFPSIAQRHGAPGIFVSTLIFMLACLPVLARMPSAPATPVAMSGSDRHLGQISLLHSTPLALIVATLSFSIGTTAIWSFSERIGHDLGLSLVEIGLTLGTASLVGVVGSVLAGWFSAGRRQLWAAAAGPLVCGTAVLVITSTRSGGVYAGAQMVYVTSWWFAYTSILSLAARVDPNGRASTAAAGAYMLSTAVGTGLAGVVADSFGYVGIGVGTLGGCLLSSVLIGTTELLQRRLCRCR